MTKKVRKMSMALETYLNDVNEEDISTDQDVQRVFCQDKKFVDELVITVLTEDYIPPIILGEIESEDGITKRYVSDGNQRTFALNSFKTMNWKVNTKVEDSIIHYQAKRRDENGKIVRDNNNEVVYDMLEFNIKGKTYDQLPKELKKIFDNYQIELAIQKCDSMKQVSKYVRRYNRSKGMSTNQKGLTWVPEYARRIKNITQGEFYKNCVPCKKAMSKNGTYEQSVCDSVMTVFHLEDWKRQAEVENKYLDEESSCSEFDTISSYLDRIEKVCVDKHQNAFQAVLIPVWVAVFNEFNKYKLDDTEFERFVAAFEDELHSRKVDGVSFDGLVSLGGTRNKKNITDKINLLCDLMKEYLHIKEEYIDAVEKEENNENVESTLDFVKENVDENIEEDDVELFDAMVQDTVKVDSPVYEQCQKALVALMAYACQKEKDSDFEEWVRKYEKTDETFSPSQKINYMFLKNNFDNYIQRGVTA